MQLHGEVPMHRMDVGDSSRSTVLEMELPDGVDRRQGSGHREGVNAFWSPEVRRAAIVEQCADVSRPQGLPPLTGQPVTHGPAQALAEPSGPQLGDVARASGPVQASSLNSGHAQALGGVYQQVGPLSAAQVLCKTVHAVLALRRLLEEFVNKWALCRPRYLLWVLALSRPLVMVFYRSLHRRSWRS